ncbi:hypothetical protein BpHYR1_050151 [Brachionus plicatilis]|uniref:Uncharacterized protein n=1 Tax=Brachionus plicatilis TaxID=10195 RepID=A0A3M7Q542_BRAPC|nr:hypothetical protein BpHYR1_050151 [Brachionus plicatilis]
MLIFYFDCLFTHSNLIAAFNLEKLILMWIQESRDFGNCHISFLPEFVYFRIDIKKKLRIEKECISVGPISFQTAINGFRLKNFRLSTFVKKIKS